jgi:hypothetical protein
MRKIIVSICLFQLFTTCFSQNKIQTGMTIGYNSSTFNGHDKPGKALKPIPGFYLGGIVNYSFNHKLSLLFNVALGSRGTKINTIDNLNEYVLFLYLDMPLVLKMNFCVDKKISPYLVFGGACGYNILALSQGILNDIRNFDIGIVSGAGVEFGKLSLGFRYNYGITRFDKSNLNLDLRNSTLSILLGMRFN